MNIFAIEADADGNIDWVASAKSQDNYRVVKMILESVQMLCTAINLQHGYQITPYKNAHPKHPSTLWVRESSANLSCSWSTRSLCLTNTPSVSARFTSALVCGEGAGHLRPITIPKAARDATHYVCHRSSSQYCRILSSLLCQQARVCDTPRARYLRGS